jgi:hypothetical protein
MPDCRFSRVDPQAGCFVTTIGDPIHQADWRNFQFGPNEQVRVCTWRDHGVDASEVQDWLESWNAKHENEVGLTLVPVDKGELPRNGFTHSAIAEAFEKQVSLSGDCEREMYFVGRNAGDFLYGVLAVTTLPLPETLGETDDQTLTHAFVVARRATAMNVVFPPAGVTEHEIWHLLGCKQHYSWDRCYAQIAALKMQEENFKEVGYFKRIGEQPFYPTWDNLSEHLLVSRAQVNERLAQ